MTARLDIRPTEDPKWLRGPVIVSFYELALAESVIPKLPNTLANHWLVEQSGEYLAFTLDLPDSEAQDPRTAAIVDLCNALVPHVRFHPTDLAEWALLPVRRANKRTPAMVAGDFKASRVRIDVLQRAAASWFARVRDGTWPIRSTVESFESYHFGLSVPGREIVRSLVINTFHTPKPVYLAGLTVDELDNEVTRLADHEWIKIEPSTTSGPNPRWETQNAARSRYQISDLGRLLDRPGPVKELRQAEMLFDR
jgi:hypothetical protein